MSRGERITLASFIILAAVVARYTLPPQDWFLVPLAWASIGALAAACVLVTILSILLHELSHALVLRAQGRRIHLICFWLPGPMRHLRCGRTWIVFGRRFGMGGLVEVYPERPDLSPPILGLSAGALSNLAVALGALAVLLWTPLPAKPLVAGVAGSGLINLMMFLSSALPRVVTVGGEPVPNDGAQVLAAIRARREGGTKPPDDAFALMLLEARRFEELEAWIEAETLRRADDPMLLQFKAGLLSETGRTAEALALWEGLTLKGPVESLLHAKNNVAHVRAVHPDFQDLAIADAYTKEILDARPDVARFQGTRGVTLLAMGRRDEAEAFLLRAFDGDRMPRSRGLVALYLGLIEADRGNVRKAGRYLRLAEYLGIPSSDLALLREAMIKATGS